MFATESRLTILLFFIPGGDVLPLPINYPSRDFSHLHPLIALLSGKWALVGTELAEVFCVNFFVVNIFWCIDRESFPGLSLLSIT